VRDILITLIVFSSLPFILRRPFLGVLMWTWLGLMNPHRMAWGFSMNLPFAFIVFVTTVIAYMASREPKRIPVSREIVVLVLFLAWMLISTFNALYQIPAWEQWDKIWRIQLGVLLTLMLTNSKERIIALTWVMALSFAFYGAKGGLWTVIHGGANRVYGPDGTFIGGNNEIGLAMVMTVPLLWYLSTQAQKHWQRAAMLVITGLTMIAIVGTHSRGALLGLAVVGVMLWFKAKNKLLPLILGLAFVAVLPYVMPDEWFERMDTIKTYEEDASAMNRIYAWQKGIAIANQRITGGGYEYLGLANGVDAHSIYFEVLSEHGYPGLALFLILGTMAWLKAGTVRRLAGKSSELIWARDLGGMIQVSLTGYACSGAFLGLAYFDFLYVIVVLAVVLHETVARGLAEIRSPQAGDSTATGPGPGFSGYMPEANGLR
jgi:probable O-glycosylation ligase (exosortase A-associated)